MYVIVPFMYHRRCTKDRQKCTPEAPERKVHEKKNDHKKMDEDRRADTQRPPPRPCTTKRCTMYKKMPINIDSRRTSPDASFRASSEAPTTAEANNTTGRCRFLAGPSCRAPTAWQDRYYALTLSSPGREKYQVDDDALMYWHNQRNMLQKEQAAEWNDCPHAASRNMLPRAMLYV